MCISSENIKQFFSAELTNPSALTMFNQIINFMPHFLVFERKSSVGVKKPSDELELLGFTKLDFLPLLKLGRTTETNIGIELKNGEMCSVSLELNIQCHLINMNGLQIG